MGLFNQKPKIVVHDGKFHVDDLFAAAALLMYLKGNGTVVRTRDEREINMAEYVADVGGINDPGQNRFDHHQKGGAGVRDNGIPYASFGLVWRKYGDDICGDRKIAARIDQKLVSPIDADDNGFSLVQSPNAIAPYGLASMLYTMRPTWKEDPKMYDTSFIELIPLAQQIINREIIIARDALEAETIVEKAYQTALDKRCVELAAPYPYQETLHAHPEPLYIVSPRTGDTNWKVECVRKNPFGFENRKSFPAAWAGLRDSDLAKVTGVPDAVFCHNGRFLAVAKSKDGAWALANLAIHSDE